MSQVQSAITAAANLARKWPQWPTYGLVDDLLPTIERWSADGHRVVLATLVTVVGTSPRPLGSQMAICDTGDVAGYVSGGCVEGAVAAEALAVLEDGKPRVLDYGAGSPVLDVQLTCGGRIAIFVHELVDPRDYATRLRAARTQRAALEIHIDLESGALRYYTAGAGGPPPPVVTDSSAVFVLPCPPPVRVLVVGGNPVALSVCALALRMGYAVDLLRPLGPAVPPPSLDPVHYDRRPIAQAMAEQDAKLDAWTAVYALTHHPDEDLVVLAHALRSPAFAVGVLGARSKIRERLRRLGEAGLDAAALARLNAPAGLALGARGPHEIALSILAQIVSLQPHAECHSARVIPMTLGPHPASACQTARAAP
ncbi:MAG TPA: XdhC family protein [Rhodanobacteraceae bacterium]